MIQQGRFARAGYAAQTDQTMEGNSEVRPYDVVLAHASELEMRIVAFDSPGLGGSGNSRSPGQIAPGNALGGFKHGRKIALKHHFAAGMSGFGADLD